MNEDLNSTIVEQTKCPNINCTSSNAYTIYADGHTHCYRCKTTTYPNKKVELNPNKVSGEVSQLCLKENLLNKLLINLVQQS